jgi:chromosomal replication initiator protein
MPAMYNYWTFVLDDIRSSLSQINFATWFSNIQFVGIEKTESDNSQKAVIKVPSAFSKNYIQKKFYSELKSSIQKYYPQVSEIDLEIDENLTPTVVSPSSQNELISEEKPQKEESVVEGFELKFDIANSLSVKRIEDKNRTFHSLNSKYTFDNFVICGSNQLAAVAAQTVAAHPGTEYNPLFIYGGVGLGKTHLMQAIGHRILENNPNFKIKYISAESMMNEYVMALQTRKTHEFRNFYRALDVLLIDDIQFLSGKEALQAEIFHTFNELHQQNKQVIFTSDKQPRDIPGIEARLTSRFSWGMIVDISQPDLEGRIAILEYKARRRGVNLNREIIEYIASSVSTNIRDLEGILNKLLIQTNALTNDQSINLETAKLCISSQHFQSPSLSESISVKGYYISPARVVEAVSNFFDMSKADVLGNSRTKEIMVARQISMWIMKNQINMSYPSIGNFFNGKDHTTVMHAVKKIDKMKESVQFSNQIHAIIQSLRN